MLILNPRCDIGKHSKSLEDIGYMPRAVMPGCEYPGRLDYYCVHCGKRIESKNVDQMTSEEMDMVDLILTRSLSEEINNGN